MSCNLSESVCHARITRSSFSASMRWSTRESSMAMSLLCSCVSVIGGLDSRLPLALFRLFGLFGLFGMIVRLLRNESVSVVRTCRGGVLGT